LEPTKSDWRRVRFKKNKVWLALDPEGRPQEKNGRVLIKYQLDQPHEYWVNPGNIQPLDAGQEQAVKDPRAEAAGAAKAPRRTVRSTDPGSAADRIDIYADGASSGNPGPAGIGVLLRYGSREKEISRYIGTATNNIAELKAIHAGLQAVKQRNLPVRVFTDSTYAYGVLALGWKARKNRELIRSIQTAISRFKDLEFVKVKGHAGDEGNERADRLATAAIQRALGKP